MSLKTTIKEMVGYHAGMTAVNFRSSNNHMGPIVSTLGLFNSDPACDHDKRIAHLNNEIMHEYVNPLINISNNALKTLHNIKYFFGVKSEVVADDGRITTKYDLTDHLAKRDSSLIPIQMANKCKQVTQWAYDDGDWGVNAVSLSITRRSATSRVCSSYNDNPSITIELACGATIEVWVNRTTTHRSDGPAIVISGNDSGIIDTKIWCFSGRLHREDDLPAVETDNMKVWYYNGSLHRKHGQPALIATHNDAEYTGYYRRGFAHRSFGPAILCQLSGTETVIEMWYTNGCLHRQPDPGDDSRPAVSGTLLEHTRWYRNGRLHRTDGPAVEYRSGNVQWYYRGTSFDSVAKFLKTAQLSDEQRVMLKLMYEIS